MNHSYVKVIKAAVDFNKMGFNAKVYLSVSDVVVSCWVFCFFN